MSGGTSDRSKSLSAEGALPLKLLLPVTSIFTEVTCATGKSFAYCTPRGDVKDDRDDIEKEEEEEEEEEESALPLELRGTERYPRDSTFNRTAFDSAFVKPSSTRLSRSQFRL